MTSNRVYKHLGKGLLVMTGVAGALAVAVGVGAITLPGTNSGTQGAHASDPTTPAAKQTAADRQWASATCTNILNWKNAIHRDAANLDLGFGALPRIQDAITATTRMLNKIDKLGPPPAVQTGQARVDVDRLRSDLEARVREIERDARSVAGGNLAAIATLLSVLENDRAWAPQIVDQLRKIVSVDLGLSLVDTRACRQLIGIPT